MAYKATRTEHSGGKNNGSAYYGHRVDAKLDSRVTRRNNDYAIIQEELRLIEEEQDAIDAMWAKMEREIMADYLEALYTNDESMGWDLDRDFDVQWEH